MPRLVTCYPCVCRWPAHPTAEPLLTRPPAPLPAPPSCDVTCRHVDRASRAAARRQLHHKSVQGEQAAAATAVALWLCSMRPADLAAAPEPSKPRWRPAGSWLRLLPVGHCSCCRRAPGCSRAECSGHSISPPPPPPSLPQPHMDTHTHGLLTILFMFCFDPARLAGVRDGRRRAPRQEA